tara:strand:+ start:187 stop:297 length:111 start_codon:yes stop_codon:yes gene_type:complete
MIFAEAYAVINLTLMVGFMIFSVENAEFTLPNYRRQ